MLKDKEYATDDSSLAAMAGVGDALTYEEDEEPETVEETEQDE